MRSRSRLTALALAVLATIAAAVTVTVVGDVDEEGRPHHFTITIGTRANPAEPDVVVDRDNSREAAEVQESSDPTPADEGPDIHEDAVDETPPGVPPDAAEEIVDSVEGVRPPTHVGGAEPVECPTRLVRNHSSRNGARVGLFVLHYTVSRPGSLDIIRRLFDTPSFGASSTFGLEPTGRCETWVRPSDKPWTNGAFNPVTETVEIIAMGTESRAWWLSQRIFKARILARLVWSRLRARGLRPRFVDPVSCAVPAGGGWTDHNALECGNTHHDVKPNFPYDVLQRQIAALAAPTPPPPPPPPPATCSPQQIQEALKKRHPDSGISVDGTIGALARRYLRAFQMEKGLPVDGVVGPRTGAALGLSGCRA